MFKPYLPFEAPGEARKMPKGAEYHSLFAEAHEWRCKRKEVELEAQLKLKNKERRALKAQIKTLLKDAGVDPREIEKRKEADKAVVSIDPVLEARCQMNEAIFKLIPEMGAGNQMAAKALLQAASDITLFLQMVYKANPELFQGVAVHMSHIPVLASLNPGWLPMAQQNLKALKVGSALAMGQLKSIAFDDEGHVCRAWAREAVTTIDSNRNTSGNLPVILAYLQAGNRPDLRPGDLPQWVLEAWELPPFSKATARQWGLLARQIIREEVPGFHEREEFKEQVANIKMRFRDEPGAASRRQGTIQNALLDRIAEAIQTITA